MCNTAVDCRWCSLIENCSKVKAAFPTLAEEVKKPKSKTVVQTKRSHAPVPAGKKACSVRGCRRKNAAHSTYCFEHRRQKMNAWRHKRKEIHHA